MFPTGNIVHVMADCGLIKSMSEGRRLVFQGVVKLDHEVVVEIDTEISEGEHTIQVGRRSPVKLEFKPDVRRHGR